MRIGSVAKTVTARARKCARNSIATNAIGTRVDWVTAVRIVALIDETLIGADTLSLFILCVRIHINFFLHIINIIKMCTRRWSHRF